ncbi:hypothetical protein [Kiloniella sp.]|uniref:hypothetical protein n=1 Tax=Kiloniella sp. TaxID=1938587 RepID=UPI003B026F09
MNSEEANRNKQEDIKKGLDWPDRRSKIAMDPTATSEVLRPRHDSFVGSVKYALTGEGGNLEADLLDKRQTLNEVRKGIRPQFTSPEWEPILDGDPIHFVEPGIATPNDFSTCLWPKLAHQVCDTDFTIVNSQCVEADGWLWSPIDMTRVPASQRPFGELIGRLAGLRVPFRMSVLIEGAGEMNYKRRMAAALRITNSSNRLVSEAIDVQLSRAQKGEAIVRFRCSLATWTEDGVLKTLRHNVAHLERAVQGWGRAEVTSKTGDPLEALFATTPGVSCSGTGTPAITSLGDALKMLPLQRPACPSKAGTHIFRSKDGKPWPYRPDTGLSPFVFDIIYGKPGMGKSVLQNSMAFSSILGAKSKKLPYMAILDIGKSSSGLISMIKAALPPGRQHEAEYIKLTMDPSMAVNPHDTQLGCRLPMTSEAKYLQGLYSLLVSGPNEEPSQDMTDLIYNVIDEMYRIFSDDQENNSPKKYTTSADMAVNAGLNELGFEIDSETLWWEVVDYLFERGKIELASRAQRFAVPVLSDAVRAANSDRVSNLMKNTKVSGESIIDVFNRRINNAAKRYPILSRETFFDLGSTRICSLDLAEVTQGTSDADKHQTSIMYMFARHVLVHHWWFDLDMISSVPPLYKPWHQARIKSLLGMSKRLMYDEFHRTGNAKAFIEQTIRDVRETRKLNVQISVATQMLDDFPKEMIDLASGTWILGLGGNADPINEALEKFNLSETAKSILRHDLGPPTKEGATVLSLSGGGDGKSRFEQLLFNSLGATELWALTTTPEDVALRDALSSRVGAVRAREILAKNYPDASAKAEITRLVDERTRLGEIAHATNEAVSADLADKLETQR